MRTVLSRILLCLACSLLLPTVISQATEQTPCQKASSTAKSYSDCKSYDNTTAETVCCYVSGSSNNTAETACLDVDILFAGKTITYSSNGVSGQLICQSITSASRLHLLKAMVFTLFAILLI